LKGYYQYNPRRIEWLTNGQVHEQQAFGGRWPHVSPTVKIDRPKIHESVFERMAAAPEAYAPAVFPPKYAVVMEDGRILDGDENPSEPAEAAVRRARAQESAWDLVWRKRIAYFLTIGMTIIAALLPFVDDTSGSARNGGAIARLIAAIGAFLPSYLSPWVR